MRPAPGAVGEDIVFEFLRVRLAQGVQTLRFPRSEVAFPERFRGRPSLQWRGTAQPTEHATAADEHLSRAPTSLLRGRGRGLPVLDLGACLFAPEEEIDDPRCRLEFTRDYRMASCTRAGLETPTGVPVLATALNERMRTLLGRSLRLRSVAAGSCGGCEAELSALGNVVFDMSRFGVQFVASPRHADGIIISGAVSRNMRSALEATYLAVPEPRVVIAVGACASNGGPMRGSPEILDGVPETIPVDLWIPGCPPHPLTVLDGLLRLLGRLELSPDTRRT